MPTIIIRRFPLPSVSIYLILSASLLFLAVMWANNTLVEEQELSGFDSTIEDIDNNIEDSESVKIISHERIIQETKKKKVGMFQSVYVDYHTLKLYIIAYKQTSKKLL